MRLYVIGAAATCGKRKDKADTPPHEREDTMRSLAIIIPGAVALALAWAGVVAFTGSSWAAFGADNWQLVMTYKGEASILDHAMSRTDCFEAMPMSDAAKGLLFSCEAEG